MKTYEELLAENEALAAHNSELVSACKLAIDMFVANECNVPNTIETLQDAIDENPQQCLAEIKAEAAEVAYYNGFKDALVIEPPLPPATCTSATIDVFAYRVDQASRYAASQYANKIRNAGTWLKDSNVNGGKRQGGEK